jgi:hypothetical protein
VPIQKLFTPREDTSSHHSWDSWSAAGWRSTSSPPCASRTVLTWRRFFEGLKGYLLRKLTDSYGNYGNHGPLIVKFYLLKMVIFHSYVSLPEGIWIMLVIFQFANCSIQFIGRPTGPAPTSASCFCHERRPPEDCECGLHGRKTAATESETEGLGMFGKTLICLV